MGFSRQEYCSGWPCPPPGDLPNPRIEPKSIMSQHLPCLMHFRQVRYCWATREAQILIYTPFKLIFSSTGVSALAGVVQGAEQGEENTVMRSKCLLQLMQQGYLCSHWPGRCTEGWTRMLLGGYSPDSGLQEEEPEGCVGQTTGFCGVGGGGSSLPRGVFSRLMGEVSPVTSCLHKCLLPLDGHTAAKLQTEFPGLSHSK